MQSIINRSFRTCLLATSAFLALASAAAAQDVAQSDDQNTVQVDDIVVTGTLRARESAISQKRDSLQVIDALGADELGRLPDNNVGEALNRLPGVSMLVEKGEGRFVQIRGINPTLNNVTINGVELGAPDNENGGRQTPMDIISGGVLGAVQVVKSRNPDQDGQGIGGTVNIKTRMPFDRPDDFYANMTARAGYEAIRPADDSYGGHDPYGVDASVSGKAADGRLGWLLGGTYTAREYVSQGIYQDDWVDDSGEFLPVAVKNNYYIIGRERLNLNGAVEVRPNDSASYFLRGFYATWDEFQHRNRYSQELSAGVVPDGPDAGVSGPNRILADIRLEPTEKTLFSVAAGGENLLGRLTLDYLVQANMNELSEPNTNWEFRSAPVFGPNSYVVGGDGIVTITPGAGSPDRQDPGLIGFRRVRFFDRSLDEDTVVGQFNARWDMNDTTWFKAGVKGARTERNLDESQQQYNPGSQPLNLGTSPGFTDGAFTNDTDAGSVPNIWLNIDGLNAYFDDSANADRFSLDTAGQLVSEFSSDYDLKETTLAAYAMGVTTLGDLEVIGGVRVESTDIDSSGFLLGSGTPTQVDDGGDYVEWLPSLLLNYRPTDSLIFRAAVTRALGRPGYNAIAPSSSYDDSNGTIGTLSVGNPDLLPRKSWNYDLSAEWYPNALTALSISLFHKDITDELVGFSQSFTTQADMQAALTERGLGGGQIDTSTLSRLDVSTTVNGGDSYLEGVELNAQAQFSMLPGLLRGLGVSASATFLDGETETDDGVIPILQQPGQTFSITGFYQLGRIDASVGYTYTDSYLTDLNTDPTLSLDQGEFGRWDARVAYRVNDRLNVFLEGVNLNNEPTTEFQGGQQRRNTEYEYVGRSVYLGLTFNF